MIIPIILILMRIMATITGGANIAMIAIPKNVVTTMAMVRTAIAMAWSMRR